MLLVLEGTKMAVLGSGDQHLGIQGIRFRSHNFLPHKLNNVILQRIRRDQNHQLSLQNALE